MIDYYSNISNKVTFVNSLFTSASQLHVNICNMTFTEIIDEELNRRNWTRSDLAREAKLNSASLSLVWSGQRKPGLEMCVKIAKALGVSEISVLRWAKLIPEGPQDVAEYEDFYHLFDKIPNERKAEVKRILEVLVDEYRSKGGSDELVKREETSPRNVY